MTGERFGIVPLSVICDDELSNAAKVVYAALATFADRRRFARPSRSQLVECSRLHERSVSRALDELVVRGHVDRITTGSGRWASTYHLTAVIHRVDTGDTPGVTNPARSGAPVSRSRRTGVTPTERTEINKAQKRRTATSRGASAENEDDDGYPVSHRGWYPDVPVSDDRGTFLPGTGWVQ